MRTPTCCIGGPRVSPLTGNRPADRGRTSTFPPPYVSNRGPRRSPVNRAKSAPGTSREEIASVSHACCPDVARQRGHFRSVPGEVMLGATRPSGSATSSSEGTEGGLHPTVGRWALDALRYTRAPEAVSRTRPHGDSFQPPAGAWPVLPGGPRRTSPQPLGVSLPFTCSFCPAGGGRYRPNSGGYGHGKAVLSERPAGSVCPAGRLTAVRPPGGVLVPCPAWRLTDRGASRVCPRRPQGCRWHVACAQALLS